MRWTGLALAAALGVTLAAAAQSAPLMPAPMPAPAGEHLSRIVPVAGGCRWGFHRNRWGRCTPNRYRYGRRPYWRPYYGYYRHSPSDYVANRLNAQELGRGYYGAMPYYRPY